MPQRLWAFGLLLLFWLCFGQLPASAEAIPVRTLTVAELQTPLELTGEWAFRGPDQARGVISLPTGWEKYYHRRLPYFGKAEYRLKLRFPPTAIGQIFKLHTDYIGGGQFRFWLNGELVGHNGSYVQSPSRRPYFKPFVLKQTETELRVELENQTFHLSGLVRPVWLGSAEAISAMHTRFLINRNLVLGVFVFLGLVHLVIYFVFLREKAMFWFGLVCLAAGVYTELYQVHNFEYLLGDLPLNWSIRLMRAAVAVIFPSFLWYTYYLSPNYISIRLVQSVSVMNIGFLLLFLFQSNMYSLLIGPWFLLTMACIVYNLYLLFRFVKLAHTWPFVFSGVAFALTLLNDLLNILGILQTVMLARYGLLCFCFAQVALLAVRFQQSYQQTLHLQGELQEVNHNLDNLVQVRTEEVRSKNQELQALVHFKDEMTQMLVHDLKSPLNALINLPQAGSELLKGQIQGASHKMLKLMDSLLQVKTLESGEWQLDLQEVSVNILVQKVIAGVQSWADGKKIRLDQRIESDLWLFVDRDLFERVLQNLLDNALKQTPLGGQIVVSAQSAAGYCEIWVEDSGPGIPPERMEQVFAKNQSFEQTHAPRSSGLGLYFCRQVIAAHQGEIWAEKRRPRGSQSGLLGGACLCLKLPLQIGPPQVDAPAWQAHHLVLLAPLAQQLAQFQVYAVSQIKTVLTPLQAEPDPLIQTWLSAVEYAVSEVNEKKYANLIAQITEYSDCR